MKISRRQFLQALGGFGICKVLGQLIPGKDDLDSLDNHVYLPAIHNGGRKPETMTTPIWELRGHHAGEAAMKTATYDRGEFFYPKNLYTTKGDAETEQTYEEWCASLESAGCNLVRLKMTGRNKDSNVGCASLEPPPYGKFNIWRTALDPTDLPTYRSDQVTHPVNSIIWAESNLGKLCVAAQNHGIKFALIPFERQEILSDWLQHPWNEANEYFDGTPCEVQDQGFLTNAREMFTDATAIQCAKNRIQFLIDTVEPYGVIAYWEMFAELTYICSDHDFWDELAWGPAMRAHIRDEMVPWVQEIAEYIHDNSTAPVGSGQARPPEPLAPWDDNPDNYWNAINEIHQVDGIDLVLMNWYYDGDLDDIITGLRLCQEKFNVPVYVEQYWPFEHGVVPADEDSPYLVSKMHEWTLVCGSPGLIGPVRWPGIEESDVNVWATGGYADLDLHSISGITKVFAGYANWSKWDDDTDEDFESYVSSPGVTRHVAWGDGRRVVMMIDFDSGGSKTITITNLTDGPYTLYIFNWTDGTLDSTQSLTASGNSLSFDHTASFTNNVLVAYLQRRVTTAFTVDLEEGNLSDFDSTTGIGLSAIAPGLVATVWCMEVDITDATARYGQVNTASDHDQIRAFLSLDPLTINALVMASGDVFTVLLVEDIFANNTFRVELGYDSTAGFRVRPGIFTDGATWSNGAWVDISANEHFVEVEWNAASAPGANDGSIEMWLDTYGTRLGDPFGVADSSVAGVDNDTRLARVFKFGAPAGLDAGTSGVLWLDHLTVNGDDTEIGHPGTLAFPTAEGAGRFSVGGRGGTLYKVTNLNNAGAGSLRAACEAAGPRIVVFEIGGTIQLTSNIAINDPYISIFGQTAPSDSGGICIRDYTLRVRTHDVIIQHFRSRPGDTSAAPPDDLDGIDLANNPASNTDSDGMVFNVIIDHCSVSWAIDENIAVYCTAPGISLIKNITVQWSITSEALSNAGHSGGEHSMGLLFGSNGAMGGKNASVHHNLMVHNRRRNPRFSEWTEFEVVNNVMHDCPGKVFDTDNDYSNFNYLGNTTGSQSADYTVLIEVNIGTNDPADYFAHQVHLDDNTGNYYVADDWEVVGKGWGAGQGAGAAAFRTAWESATPIHVANSDLSADARAIAYVDVLACAGCLAPSRDAVDARVVQDVWDDNTGLIDSQADVGGWPALAAGTPPTDTDGDGMPDPWEIANGTDPNVPDGNQYDLSTEWTNVEVWVSELGICVRGSSTTSTTTLSTTTLSTTSTSTLSTSTLSTTTTTTVPTYCPALTISYGKITLESLTAAEVADREAIAAAAQGL